MQRKKQKRILKILLPVSLLILLTMQTSYAESGSRLLSVLEPKYGIDLTKSYTGREVQELIDIVVEESEKSITEAYNAGYKQGVLTYMPDVAYWKTKAQQFETEVKKQKTRSLMFGLGGVSIGVLGGMGLSLGLRLSY